MNQLWNIWVLLLITCCPVLAGPRGKRIEVTGVWSEVSDGLRGRLIVAEGSRMRWVDGTHILAVYLELENVKDGGDPMLINTTYTNFEGVLLKSGGKEVAVDKASVNIPQLHPCQVVLPWDSSLRMRVSVIPREVPPDAGALLGLGRKAWLLTTKESPYYLLRSTFSAKKSGDKKMRDFEWAGSLVLPEIHIDEELMNVEYAQH